MIRKSAAWVLMIFFVTACQSSLSTNYKVIHYTETVTAPETKELQKKFTIAVVPKVYYPKMRLVDIIATDDDPLKAYEKAKELLTAYPDLTGIIGNSSVSPPAAAQAVKEAGKAGKVKVVGLSSPNLMRDYLNDGSAQMATLWSPKKLGYLTVVLAKNLLENKMPYDGQDIYNVGNIRVNGDTVIMGEPIDFTASNVDQYDF